MLSQQAVGASTTISSQLSLQKARSLVLSNPDGVSKRLDLDRSALEAVSGVKLDRLVVNLTRTRWVGGQPDRGRRAEG